MGKKKQSATSSQGRSKSKPSKQTKKEKQIEAQERIKDYLDTGFSQINPLDACAVVSTATAIYLGQYVMLDLLGKLFGLTDPLYSFVDGVSDAIDLLEKGVERWSDVLTDLPGEVAKLLKREKTKKENTLQDQRKTLVALRDQYEKFIAEQPAGDPHTVLIINELQPRIDRLNDQIAGIDRRIQEKERIEDWERQRAITVLKIAKVAGCVALAFFILNFAKQTTWSDIVNAGSAAVEATPLVE